MSDNRVRIQKALADAGVASRRKAEELVAAGRVRVNGELAAIGQLVDPHSDAFSVDGRAVAAAEQRTYLVLAKPTGVTSTVRDRHAARTVIDLVPREFRAEAARLYPVGRLDRDSEGLLLLTNDGSWAQRMLHPSHGVEREYAVGLDRELDPQQVRLLERGIPLEEGVATLSRLVAATSADRRMLGALLGPSARPLVWYRVTLRQGMKRQIRRMFASAGARVFRLVRLRFGTVRLTGMKLGDVRPLTTGERRQLDTVAGGEGIARRGQQRGDRRGEQRGAGRRDRRGLVVSVDGPGGSGKSSVGAGVAAKLGYRFCDTGVLYRGLTWLALERGVDVENAAGLESLVAEMQLVADDEQRFRRIVIDGRDVTEELHTAEVDREVSRVSQHASVRARLLPLQHALAAEGRIVMAGRDIGTVVLPDADLKVYLDVSVEERARRRALERGVQDDREAVAQIEDELRARDAQDSTRETAPLKVPDGAKVIRTDGNTLDETIAEVVAAVRLRERELEGEREGRA